MITVVPIVEGHGEVAAVPVLLKRLRAWKTPEQLVHIGLPIKVSRDRFLRREDEFRRFLLLAVAKCGPSGWILILLDADDDCPASVGADLLARAKACVGHRRVSVVLANREYEAWFIASAASLAGFRGLSISVQDTHASPEIPRDAKGWIKQRMPHRSYGETTDQAAFSGHMDLQLALARSRSFKKLCDEWVKQCTVVVSPA